VRRFELGASIADVSRACEVNPNGLHRWGESSAEVYGVQAAHVRVEIDGDGLDHPQITQISQISQV
jgi:hypothetical protein